MTSPWQALGAYEHTQAPQVFVYTGMFFCILAGFLFVEEKEGAQVLGGYLPSYVCECTRVLVFLVRRFSFCERKALGWEPLRRCRRARAQSASCGAVWQLGGGPLPEGCEDDHHYQEVRGCNSKADSATCETYRQTPQSWMRNVQSYKIDEC